MMEIEKNKRAEILLENISQEWQKIEELYACLIQALLDKISQIDGHDLALATQLIIDQQVHYEQIAAHHIRVDKYVQELEIKYYNKYLLLEKYPELSVEKLEIIHQEILEKIGFLKGITTKGKELLGSYSMKIPWKMDVFEESRYYLRRFVRRPWWQYFNE